MRPPKPPRMDQAALYMVRINFSISGMGLGVCGSGVLLVSGRCMQLCMAADASRAARVAVTRQRCAWCVRSSEMGLGSNCLGFNSAVHGACAAARWAWVPTAWGSTARQLGN
jgi:hypothetical protein